MKAIEFQTQVLDMLAGLSKRMDAIEQAQEAKPAVATTSKPKAGASKSKAKGKAPAKADVNERGALGIPAEDVVVKENPVNGRMYLHIRNDGVQGGRYPEALAAKLKVGRKAAFDKQPRGRYVQDSFPFKASKQLMVAEGQDAQAVAKAVASALVASVWDSRKTSSK